MDGEARGIGSDDSFRLAELRNALEQIALDFKIFGDRFHDPIGLGDARQSVLKVADEDAVRECGGKECGRARLFSGSETGADDFVALGSGSIRGESRRDDIQQDAGHAGIGEMRGDPRTHGASAEHNCLVDSVFHEWAFRGGIGMDAQVTKPGIAGSNQPGAAGYPSKIREVPERGVPEAMSWLRNAKERFRAFAYANEGRPKARPRVGLALA